MSKLSSYQSFNGFPRLHRGRESVGDPRRRHRARPTRTELERRLCEPWERDELARELVERNPDGMTLEEVGEYFGITRERVRQIEANALLKLRYVDSPAFAVLMVKQRGDKLRGRGQVKP